MPYRSFTSTDVNAFPALKVFFHADDYVPGSLVWVARKGGLTLKLTAPAVKDADGVYTLVTNGVSSVTGTMPTLSGYVVAAANGKLQTGSTTVGVRAIFGSNSVTGIGNTAGTSIDSSVIVTGILHSGLPSPVTAGSKVCRAAYFDLVDTTDPLAVAVLSPGLSTDQVIQVVETSSDLGGQILFTGSLSSAFGVNSLDAINDGRRIKTMMLLDFASSMTSGEFQLAAANMAYTQEVYAGWRNRA